MKFAPMSWVAAANDPASEFPLANLPYGVFADGASSQIGVAIGDQVLGLRDASEAGLLEGLPLELVDACRRPTLQPLMALGHTSWQRLREHLIDLLGVNTGPETRDRIAARLRSQDSLQMVLPTQIGDYTDFYASLHHAERVGRIFRPDQPLLPNYRHLPIGYHARASSIVISGTDVRRPWGQRLDELQQTPVFAPTQSLDFELEMGVFIGGGNVLGEPIPIAQAHRHIFGFCLLNDWSARDIQSWEYRPLGPFLGKSFATSISPWIVTPAALIPYRVPMESQTMESTTTLAYLRDERSSLFDVTLEVGLQTARMRERDASHTILTRTNMAELHWSMEQLIAHHTSNGCNLRPGDLLGTGTISGAEPGSEGCLLEKTAGRNALRLPNGEERIFLADGDRVTLRGFTSRTNAPRIGFGSCTGMIVAAREAYGVAADVSQSLKDQERWHH